MLRAVLWSRSLDTNGFIFFLSREAKGDDRRFERQEPEEEDGETRGKAQDQQPRIVNGQDEVHDDHIVRFHGPLEHVQQHVT